MLYMVSLSGGAGSTIAAHRVVEKYGAENVILAFANTNSEHPSLYAALQHMRVVTLPHVRFIHLDNNGETIWDCFEKHGVIRLPKGGCKASLELKHKPLDRLRHTLGTPETLTAVSGLAYDEKDRQDRFNERVAPYPCEHPLNWRPILSACQQIALVEEWGYPKQSMYEKGYPHNNCAGSCVIAGMSQWIGLYHDNPDLYRYAAMREKQFRERFDSDFTICKDRRGGGKAKSMTLEELEMRILNNDLKNVRDFRSNCACMTPDF